MESFSRFCGCLIPIEAAARCLGGPRARHPIYGPDNPDTSAGNGQAEIGPEPACVAKALFVTMHWSVLLQWWIEPLRLEHPARGGVRQELDQGSAGRRLPGGHGKPSGLHDAVLQRFGEWTY